MAKAAEHPGAIGMLGYSSEAINDYYTAAELGFARTMPATGVPPEIAQALEAPLILRNRLWPLAADAVMSAPPDAWRRWRKYRRRHRTGGQFALTSSVHLSTAPGQERLTLQRRDRGTPRRADAADVRSSLRRARGRKDVVA